MKKSISFMSMLFALVLTIFALVGCGTTTEYTVPQTTSAEYVAPTVDVEEEAVTETVDAEAIVTETANVEDVADEAVNAEEVANENVAEDVDVTGVEAEEFAFDSIEAIVAAAHVRATCQDDLKACVVKLDSSNPYDVTWDFGPAWNAYVDACDWSLLFDATYYKNAYPMLAVLYNNDDTLLLQHFATVGVHEGRQGNANFNVLAYINNASTDVQTAFAGQVEGAYIYYMLHYDNEKNVNTISCNDGSPVKTQLFTLYTKVQQVELDKVNYYREKVGATPVVLNEELCNFANYRAYINRTNGTVYGEGHAWLRDHQDLAWNYLNLCGFTNHSYMDENTITNTTLCGTVPATLYRTCTSHYEAMVENTSNYVGVSNYYYTSTDRLYSQFDLFVP